MALNATPNVVTPNVMNTVYYIRHCITLEVVTYGPLVSFANVYAVGHIDVHSRLEGSSTFSDKGQFTDTRSRGNRLNVYILLPGLR